MIVIGSLGSKRRRVGALEATFFKQVTVSSWIASHVHNTFFVSVAVVAWPPLLGQDRTWLDM